MARGACDDPRRPAGLRIPDDVASRTIHHTKALPTTRGPAFFASVSLLPQFEHRKRSRISGTSPRGAGLFPNDPHRPEPPVKRPRAAAPAVHVFPKQPQSCPQRRGLVGQRNRLNPGIVPAPMRAHTVFAATALPAMTGIGSVKLPGADELLAATCW